jgi:hypothetical protein
MIFPTQCYRRQTKGEIVRLCCGLLLFASLGYGTDRTLEEEKSPTIIFRKIAVTGVKFDEDYVVQRCRRFLKTHKDRKLIRFTLVPDESEATIAWYGCDHCESYPFWRTQYDEVTKKMYPIGEMMAFGNNAVVRYRSLQGTVTETVLSGSDPRTIVIDGFKGEDRPHLYAGSDAEATPRTICCRDRECEFGGRCRIQRQLQSANGSELFAG